MRWLVPAATALWGLWTWAHEREIDRSRERARLAALYVNPFLSACEDLQSRIYNILEQEGLHTLRLRYPDGSYAEETLYLIVRWFGWLKTVLRYSPYTQDRQVIRLAEAMRNAFATSDYPVGAFAFFRPEQKSLGRMVMTRFDGQYGIELDTIPYCEFLQVLERPILKASDAVQQSLAALRDTEEAAKLPGRERLVTVQNYLVELLNYVERREGFSLFPGVRKKCRHHGMKHVPSLVIRTPPSKRAGRRKRPDGAFSVRGI
ncbi:MAG: hypothetical protein AB1568_04880 [Thermodesulfobacteriota bacterium]